MHCIYSKNMYMSGCYMWHLCNTIQYAGRPRQTHIDGTLFSWAHGQWWSGEFYGWIGVGTQYLTLAIYKKIFWHENHYYYYCILCCLVICFVRNGDCERWAFFLQIFSAFFRVFYKKKSLLFRFGIQWKWKAYVRCVVLLLWNKNSYCFQLFFFKSVFILPAVHFNRAHIQRHKTEVIYNSFHQRIACHYTKKKMILNCSQLVLYFRCFDKTVRFSLFIYFSRFSFPLPTFFFYIFPSRSIVAGVTLFHIRCIENH